MASIFLLFSSFLSLLHYKLKYFIICKLRQKYKNVDLIFWKLLFIVKFWSVLRLSFALGGVDTFWEWQNQRNLKHFQSSAWMCFMNTYFNGVRPIFINWISVVQHIFSSGTSALLNLQMCCCWLNSQYLFPPQHSALPVFYLCFSWPVCPTSHRNPLTQWAHLTPSIFLTFLTRPAYQFLFLSWVL